VIIGSATTPAFFSEASRFWRCAPACSFDSAKRCASIRAKVGGIWRTAEPTHFQEPLFETLTRRVETVLRERFDHKSTDGKSVVDRCVLVVGTGIRINR
jgi:hypothetical protein